MHSRTERSDSRSGLIMGDFASGRSSGHEGWGGGKRGPPGGVT